MPGTDKHLRRPNPAVERLVMPAGGGAFSMRHISVGLFLVDQNRHRIALGSDKRRHIPLEAGEGWILPADATGLCEFDEALSFLKLEVPANFLSDVGFERQRGGDGDVRGANILGVGGAGVVGAATGAISIVNDGRIEGGVNSWGGTQANAISFFGNDNRLELHSNSVISGDVVVSGGGINTLALGGSTNATFDTSLIGAAQQYRGFDTFEKTGTSIWTLTGTGAQNWSLVDGTLRGDTNSLAGNVAFASGAGSRNVVFDQAFDGTYGGAISGDGALIKTGTGTVTLTGLSSVGWTVATGGLTTAAERFGGDAAVAAGASLTFDQTADAAYAGMLSGAGSLHKIGSGLLNLTGNSTLTGPTTV